MSDSFTLTCDADRQRFRVELSKLNLKEKTYTVILREGDERTVEQNKALWPMLNDLSNQLIWHGFKLSPEEWKIVLTAGVVQMRTVPGINGGFVSLGYHTSKMSKRRFSDLLELGKMLGDSEGVRWTAPRRLAADYQRELGGSDAQTGKPNLAVVEGGVQSDSGPDGQRRHDDGQGNVVPLPQRGGGVPAAARAGDPDGDIDGNRLIASAKWAPHCMNPFCRQPNPTGHGNLCLAHPNEQESGRGFAHKGLEELGAVLCDTCHKLVDGQLGGMSIDEKHKLMTRANLATVSWWKSEGLL